MENLLLLILVLFGVWLIGYLSGIYVNSEKQLDTPIIVELLVMLAEAAAIILIAFGISELMGL
jgi:hypothetical protein